MSVPSIYRKLYFRIVAIVTMLWLTVVLGVGWVVKKETDEVFDSSLQELGQRILTLSAIQIERAEQTEPERLQPIAHDEYLTYQVIDHEGHLRLRSHDAPAEPFNAPHSPGFHYVGNQRFYVDVSKDHRYIIQVAEPVDHRSHTLVHISEFLLLPLLLLWPLCIRVIYLSIRDASNAFDLFTKKITERRSINLRPLDSDKLPVELHQLSEAINALMNRLKQALDTERSLAANSAHELRTPIASAISQLDLLRSTDLPPSAIQRINSALDKLRGLEATAVKLLQLARAESGSSLNMQPVDLTHILELFAAELSHRASSLYHFELPDQSVWVRGDLDIIGVAVQNLLENAGKYSPAGTGIEIELKKDGALSVRNDCEAIPPDRLGALTQRFVRASQLPLGSGIGLAIVATVATHCNARLDLSSPCLPNGRGFEAKLQFQLSSENSTRPTTEEHPFPAS